MWARNYTRSSERVCSFGQQSPHCNKMKSNNIYKCHFSQGCLAVLHHPLTSGLPWFSHELVLLSRSHKHWISAIFLPLLPPTFLCCGLGEEEGEGGNQVRRKSPRSMRRQLKTHCFSFAFLPRLHAALIFLESLWSKEKHSFSPMQIKYQNLIYFYS